MTNQTQYFKPGDAVEFRKGGSAPVSFPGEWEIVEAIPTAAGWFYELSQQHKTLDMEFISFAMQEDLRRAGVSA